MAQELAGTRISFILSDGIFVCISFFNWDTNGSAYYNINNASISFDLNAGGKPNMFGKDLFQFVIENSKLLPRNYKSAEIAINNNCVSSGEYCAAKIMNDNWQIKDDYQW